MPAAASVMMKKEPTTPAHAGSQMLQGTKRGHLLTQTPPYTGTHSPARELERIQEPPTKRSSFHQTAQALTQAGTQHHPAGPVSEEQPPGAQTAAHVPALQSTCIHAPVAVQQLQHAPIPQGARTQGLPGQLKSMRLTNFMCHSSFEVSFGPHVTLISGQNGSGKSAIMQGLQACLGVTARNTGRAKQLAAFVGANGDKATVQVVLWNEGDAASTYHPEQYGPAIIIEKDIRRQGSSETRIYNFRHEMMSRRKDDLDAILEFFDINAANPMTIITQDMARGFFAGGAEERRKKYSMYMEATLVQQTQEDLRKAEHQIETTRNVLKDYKSKLSGLKQQLQQLEQARDKLQAADKLAVTEGHMNNVLVWTIYRDVEARTGPIEQQLHAHTTSGAFDAQQAELAAAEATVLQLQAQQAGKTEQLNSAHTSGERARQELESLKGRLAAAKSQYTQVHRQVQQAQEQLANLQGDKTVLEEQLVQESDQGRADAARQQMEAFQAQLDECQAELQHLETEYQHARSHYLDIIVQRGKASSAEATAQTKISTAQDKVVKVQVQLKNAGEGQRAKVLMLGGEQMEQLVRLMAQKRHGWRAAPPVGPIGLYLSLTDQNWSVAVEAVIQVKLRTFICFDVQDVATLQQMADQVRMPRQALHIVRTSLNQVPYSNLRVPPQGYTSAMDVLRVSHPDPAMEVIIRNTLIDSCKIERTLLFQTPDDGRRLTYDLPLGPDFARGVDITGAIYLRTGSTTQTRPNMYKGLPVLSNSIQDLQVQLQGNLRAAQEHMQQAIEMHAAAEQEVQQLKKQTTHWNTLMTNAQTRKGHKTRELKAIQQRCRELQPAAEEGAEAAAMQVATQALQQCMVDIAQAKLHLQALEEAEKAAKERVTEEAAHLKQRREEIQVEQEGLGGVHQELEALALEEAHARQQVAMAQQALRLHQQQTAQLQAALAHQQNAVAIDLENANMVCSPEEEQESRPHVLAHLQRKAEAMWHRNCKGGPPDPTWVQEQVQLLLSHKELQKESEAIAAILAQADEMVDGESLDVVEEQCEQLSQQLEKRSILFKLRVAGHAVFCESYNRRSAALVKLKRDHEVNTTNTFDKYMKRRGHLGSINIDDEKGELGMSVKIKGRDDKTVQAVTDLKQLSGGERSYTTVAFLLAVGELSEGKFRCLDEFDVFMDSVNRRIATETLLEFALANDQYQYVLLTPQDIQAVEDARSQLEQKRVKHGQPRLAPQFCKVIKIAPARPAARV